MYLNDSYCFLIELLVSYFKVSNCRTTSARQKFKTKITVAVRNEANKRSGARIFRRSVSSSIFDL